MSNTIIYSAGFKSSALIVAIVGSLLGGLIIGYFISPLMNPAFDQNYQDGSNEHYAKTSFISPVIDGNISYDEYKLADWKLTQYFDVNNSLGDVDGNNYVYVGQDNESIYVAIDLVSDQTNSNINEWFSVWLNTANRVFGGQNESWYSFRNNGSENIVYEVDHAKIKSYTTENSELYESWFQNASDYQSANLTYGSSHTSFSNWADTETYNNDYFASDSQNWGSGANFGDKIVLNFSFNLLEYFSILPEYKSEILDSISNANITMKSWLTNYPNAPKLNGSDIDYSRVSIKNNGTWNDSPLQMNKSIMAADKNTININNSAFADGLLEFSIEIYNESIYYNTEQFVFWIDSMDISFDIDSSDYYYGTSTLTNYTLAIGFNQSYNSLNAHRIYELKIPISELEGYTLNSTLGIYIQGAGGLNFDGVGLFFTGWYFGVGFQFQFAYMMLWSPAVPQWSVNYYYFPMNRKRVVLI